MRITDAFEIAIRAVRVAPLRAIFSIISFMIGIAAPTFIFGVSNGMAQRVVELAQEDFRRKLNIYPSWEEENIFVPTLGDVARLEQSQLDIESVGASIIERQMQATAFGQSVNVQLHGITENALSSMGQELIFGTSEFGSGQAGEMVPCIINRPFLNAIEQANLPHEIQLQRMRCAVIGVVEVEAFSGRNSPVVYVPIEEARRVIQDADQSNRGVSLRFNPRRKPDEVERISIIFPTYYEMVGSIEAILLIFNKDRLDQNAKLEETQLRYTSYDAERQERAVAELNLFLSIVMVLVVAFVALTVGLNAYYAVRERSEEISIQLALGATRTEIVAVLLIESLVYVLVGGLLGAIVATQLSAPFSDSSDFRVAVDTSVLLNSSLVLLLAAFLASALPAWRASRVDPATALKH